MPSGSLSNALTTRMTYLSDRQAILSGNIANANTPGYRPADLSFKPYLEQASSSLQMASTNSGHMHGSAAPASGKVMRSARFVQFNGNGVRLDDQLMKMNQTELDFRLATQVYNQQMKFQKLAIGRNQ